MKPSVFVIEAPDQLPGVAAMVERSRRFATEAFPGEEEALARLREEPPDAILYRLHPDPEVTEGFTARVRAAHSSLPLVVIGDGGREAELERVLAAGATDFVLRPLQPGLLATRIARCLEQVPVQELASSAAQLRFDPHAIIGSHPLTEEVRSFATQVGAVPHVSALLLGESGTGKNLVARAIHTASDCAHLRFVEVNCAALPATLLESELFGYEKGAFTNADQTKRGLVEVADGGTLFLDEIGSMPAEMQAKLLTFLESRRFRRVGATQERAVELRVVAATNEELAETVRKGAFRSDLYYRLNVASHLLPPLRRIRSDIPALTGHFVQRAAHYFGKPVPGIDATSQEALMGYDWPGNARELRNVVERAMIFHRDAVLRIEAPSSGGTALAENPFPPGLTLAEVERRYIQRTLEEMGGNVAGAADRLGVSRKVLWQRRRQHGLL